MKKNVLITGSSYEYMQNMCEFLIDLDNFIYLAHENWKQGMHLAEDILKSNNIKFIHVDNKDIRSVQMLYQRICDENNNINAIINVVDLSEFSCTNMKEISLWEWDNVINCALRQLFILQKVFSENMIHEEQVLINIIVKSEKDHEKNIFSEYILQGILSFSDTINNNKLLDFRMNNILIHENMLYKKESEIFNVLNSFIKDSNINGAFLKL